MRTIILDKACLNVQDKNFCPTSEIKQLICEQGKIDISCFECWRIKIIEEIRKGLEKELEEESNRRINVKYEWSSTKG